MWHFSLFANTFVDAQKLMRAMEEFGTHTKLSVNGSKTKIMFEKSQNNNKSCIMYNNESHLNVWKASNILALKFLQIIDGMNVLLAA